MIRKVVTAFFIVACVEQATSFSPRRQSLGTDHVLFANKKKTKVSTKPNKGFSSSKISEVTKGPTPRELLSRSESQFDDLEIAYAQEMEREQQRANAEDDDEDTIEISLRLKNFIMCARLKGDDVRAKATGVVP